MADDESIPVNYLVFSEQNAREEADAREVKTSEFKALR